MKRRLSGDGLQREIGLWSAIVLVVANMVGTGVFTTSGFIVQEMPNAQALLIAWLIGGIFALTGALCYGELGAMLPYAGGEYVYLRRSFGALPAFLSGWISLVVGFSAPIAAAAIAFAVYLMGGKGGPPWFVLEVGGRNWITVSPVSVTAIGVVIVFSLVHYHSLRLGQRVQNVLTGFKVLFVLAFGLGSFWLGNGDGERLRALVHGGGSTFEGGAFAISLIFVSFAYSGWNAAAYLGGEIRRPQRNLPLALLVGTVFVTGVYLLLNLAYVYALPVESMKGMLDVGAGAASALFGSAIGSAISWAIALGLLSVVSAMVMTGPRVYYAMARDGLFFRGIGRVDPNRHTPVQAIAFQAVIAVVMIVSATFDSLLIYMGFTLSLSAMVTVAGLVKLRLTEPDLARPYTTWGYPLTPLLFIAGNLWITVYSVFTRPVATLYGLGTIAVGIGVYVLFHKGGVKPATESGASVLLPHHFCPLKSERKLDQ